MRPLFGGCLWLLSVMYVLRVFYVINHAVIFPVRKYFFTFRNVRTFMAEYILFISKGQVMEFTSLWTLSLVVLKTIILHLHFYIQIIVRKTTVSNIAIKAL